MEFPSPMIAALSEHFPCECSYDFIVTGRGGGDQREMFLFGGAFEVAKDW